MGQFTIDFCNGFVAHGTRAQNLALPSIGSSAITGDIKRVTPMNFYRNYRSNIEDERELSATTQYRLPAVTSCKWEKNLILNVHTQANMHDIYKLIKYSKKHYSYTERVI
jgi:hypothetical protein